MELLSLLEYAVGKNASDIFIIAGRALAISVNGEIIDADTPAQNPETTKLLVQSIYKLAKSRAMELLDKSGNDDFSFTVAGLSRFRASVYIQRGSYACVIRVISFNLPDPTQINIPEKVMALSEKKKGLVLVTGTAGSGKSTTLACIIDRINSTKKSHIITIEDPLEYIHRHKMSIVSQREIASDVESYVSAIKSALRQSPDVILLGEMRDLETITTALTAAETGHMVYSTLHTVGAANTIDRILDAFAPDQRYHISTQLSMILEAVVSQQLLPAVDGSLVLATEVMTVTPAIRNLIRENKIHQINNVIFSAQGADMISMDTSILNLYKQGKISEKTAVEYSSNPEFMQKKIAMNDSSFSV